MSDDGSGTRWLDADEQQAWVALMSILLRLPGALDSQLQRDSRFGFFEYLVLSQLSMAQNRTLRMSELAVLANGSLSRLSNVAKRLEHRGWIRREPDPADGRYTIAILTDLGWKQVVAAAPGHVEAVRQLVFDPLTSEQVAVLHDIGQRLQQQVVHGDPCAAQGPTACPPDDEGPC